MLLVDLNSRVEYKYLSFKITFVCNCFLLLVNPFFAQQIVRSTIGTVGSTMTVEKVLVQQTIGQSSAIISTNNEKGFFVTQGFHQPVYIETLSNELNVHVFPNPNTGSFNFKVDVALGNLFNYTVSDIHGKVILFGKGEGNLLQSLIIEQPTVGIYFLNIVSGSRSSSFKINVINN